MAIIISATGRTHFVDLEFPFSSFNSNNWGLRTNNKTTSNIYKHIAFRIAEPKIILYIIHK